MVKQVSCESSYFLGFFRFLAPDAIGLNAAATSQRTQQFSTRYQVATANSYELRRKTAWIAKFLKQTDLLHNSTESVFAFGYSAICVAFNFRESFFC